MKKLLCVLLLVFVFILDANANLLKAPTYSGGAETTTGGTTIITTTVGETSGSSTVTSYGLKLGYMAIAHASAVTPTTLPPGVILQTNSAVYNVNQQALVVSFYTNQTGAHSVLAGLTTLTSESITATGTYTVTATNVSLDQANQWIIARVSTLNSNSVWPTFNAQQLSLKPEGGIYQANNITTYAGINEQTLIYAKLKNMSGQSQNFIFKATQTGASWNNIYYDGTTNITSQVISDAGYPITISAAGIKEIIVDLSPGTNAENLTIALSFYQLGYVDNAIIRNIYAQPSTTPGVTSAIGSGKVFIEVSADGSSGASISSLSSTQEVTVKLYIFNLAGKLVHQEDLQVQTGPNIKDINMPTNLGKGTYIFQVVYNGRIISSGKFVNIN